MKKAIKTYAIGILIPVMVGLLSAFLTRNNMDLYESIVRPAVAPPAILFPIVWTVLYVLMGIGSVLICLTPAEEPGKTRALFAYGLQLAVNFFWSILFFNQRAFLLSFLWLLLLWALILSMTLRFRPINKTAALLQIPYLVWVTFAGYLNLMIWLLNR